MVDWWQLAQTSWIGLLSGVNYALFAAGLTLVFGVMFVVNMAQGQFFMMGAIITYLLISKLGLNFFLAGFIAVILTAAVGLATNRIAIRPLIKGSSWPVLLSTIAVSMIMLQTVLSTIGPTAHVLNAPLSGIMHFGKIAISKQGLLLFVGGLAIIVAVHLFLKKSRVGKDMRATIQSPIGAALCGINPNRVYDYTLIIGSALAALGGISAAVLQVANPFMGNDVLIIGFAIVIVAGMGNLKGAVIIGIMVGVIQSLFGFLVTPYFSEVLVYGIMVLTLLFKPEGLFTAAETT
jgi:branched-chain amino acid transport system permease protein